MTTDFTLILPDRVGALAHTFAALRSGGIDVGGYAGFPAWAGEGILHILVADAEAAREALRRAGIDIREERELLVTRPLGGTADVTAVLELIAAANVNIDLIYQLADGRLALGVNKLEAARRAIGEGIALPA